MISPPIVDAAHCRLHLIEALDRLQVDEHVGRDDAAPSQPEQIAAAAGKATPPVRPGALAATSADRVLDVAGVGVGKGLHASAPRILSRVIGRSFMRRPIALKTALATAAGAGTLLDSPMLFAPNGP